MATYRLISLDICPFVQRAAIMLQAKGVDYDIEYVDLRDRPQWFVKLSPLGKVPLLEVEQGTVLFESQVIAEYLDETNAPSMHPSDPLEKAKDRALIELVSNALGWTWVASTTEKEAESRALIEKVKGALERIVAARHDDGPFFHGEKLSIVDAAAGPLLQRLKWADEVGGYGLFDALPAAQTWYAALQGNGAIQKSTVPDIKERVRASFGGWLASRRDAA
jgi:glutathione S-transferase